MNDYPLLRFVARHGLALSLLCMLALLLGGGWVAYTAANIALFAGIVIASAILFVVLQTLCEMVRVIVETLLPR